MTATNKNLTRKQRWLKTLELHGVAASSGSKKPVARRRRWLAMLNAHGC